MSESDGQEASLSGSSLHSGSKNNSSHEDGSGPSISGSSTGSTRGATKKEEEIARSEDRAVTYSRVLVLGVLLVSATVAGVVTWIYGTEAEEENFHSQFEDFATEIADVSQNNAANVFGLIKSFSATITSFAISSASKWPQVTVPHFEARGGRFLNISKCQLLSFAPIVSNLETWSSYAVANQNWIQESYDLRGDATSPAPIESEVYYSRLEDGVKIPEKGKAEYAPLWQEARAPTDTSSINFNLMSHEVFDRVFHLARQIKSAVLSEVFDPSTLLGEEALFKVDNGEFHPESILVQPVFDEFDEEIRSVVGVVVAVIPWDVYFENLLHDGADGLVCVMRDTCGDVFSYRIDGPHAAFLGKGDHHDSKYDSLEFAVPFAPFVDFSDADDGSHCEYSLHIYPTHDLEDEYHTSKPAVFTSVIVLMFVFTSLVFMSYDFLVQRRQVKVHTAAVKSNAIVSSLFPAEIRDRLFQQQNEEPDDKGTSRKNGVFDTTTSKFRQKNFLDDEDDDHAQTDGANHSSPDMYDTKPIADLFPNTTVMFGDIAGFTAWSSVREPFQVFTLLETVYRAFDMIARRRRVFKVETIGDCYVAVTGLPEPRKDHAVAMSRFARDCLLKMNELCRQLEVTLGPDTGDLAMRIGLHSGPVTAGVLRGEKSRFQLFGDTVNTTARVESTGMRNRIHISEETANLLETASKGHWIKPREDLVHAKGKGELKTFWLVCKDASGASERSGGSTPTSDVRPTTKDLTGLAKSNPEIPETVMESAIPEKIELSPKMLRLVDWNTDVLQRLLKLIIAKRSARTISPRQSPEAIAKKEWDILSKDGTVLDEVEEIVTLPNFDAAASKNQIDPGMVQIPPQVAEQLREYVKSIAAQYRDNPFHNFEHASHVTMSVSKLLSRIAAPDIDETDNNLASSLHDHTYGITSDPLTQFAVVLSALIHDVDHVGLPNFLLVEENAGLATAYKNKSVAEQNAVDLAWQTLMDPSFADLRNCIYDDTADLKRFRQLLVNTVLATDIFDKELQTLRKSRWAKAFDHHQNVESDKQEDVNRKATIVIEHLIQASDVAHTMQHWHIYQKWNERLFNEMYLAYKAGRSPKDPSGGWYQGELGFFDNYIIPLAKKLQACGVFGVSSDEYLNYALENRREWASKGEQVVQKMMSMYIIKDEEPTTDAKPSSGYMVPPEPSSPSHIGSNGGKEEEQVPIAPANASPYDNVNH